MIPCSKGSFSKIKLCKLYRELRYYPSASTKHGNFSVILKNYAAPFDPISQPIEKTIVRQRVEMIFDFRYKKLQEMFGQ
jgi:hypothetical protein